jgi:hypothetical protein
VEKHFADAIDAALSNQVKKIAFVSTAQYSATDKSVILCDASGGGIVVNLPSASVATGYTYFIKKTDASTNTVTVSAYGSETIDGAPTVLLSLQYESLVIVCDGSRWLIFN